MAQRQRGDQGTAKGKRRTRTPEPPPPASDRPSEEELQGPPPAEATIIRSDREREEAERIAEYTDTGPELSGGDVDADWERAASVGEEAVGGSVTTPDQSVVDELGEALGVPQGPDEEVRTSDEILEDRDEHRWEEQE